MKALLVEASDALPLVHFSLCFPSGAAHQPLDKQGLARLTGRMLRRGAGDLSGKAFEERLDALGAQVSVSVGLAATFVSCEVLKRSLPEALRLCRLMLEEPRFEAEEWERLVRKAQAEIVSSRDEDGLLAGRGMRRQLFAGHAHGRRVGGSIDGLAALKLEDARAWHAQHYARGQTIVAFTGDVEAGQPEALAEQLLAALPPGETTPYPAPEPELPGGRKLVIVDKPQRSQTRMVFGTLGSHPHDDDHTALLVGNTAFGGSFTSRLMQAIRVERGWSYGAGSQLASSRIREAFSMYSSPASSDAAACIQLHLEMLEQWCNTGIREDELHFCKDYMRRSYAFEIDTPKKRLRQSIERQLLDLPDDHHSGYVERVGAVTLDQVNTAIRERIHPHNLCLSVVASEAEWGDALREACADFSEQRVEPYDIE